MALVRIMLDPYRLLLASTSESISVNGPADYVPVCTQIHQTLHGGQKDTLEVHVYDATVGEWLKEWASKYGDHLVQTRTYRALDALKDRWGIEVPVLSETEIIRSGLLDEEVTPREGQSFDNLVLEHCYHPFFAYPTFLERLLANFLNDADKVDWKKNANRPIVARIFRERLEQWANKESNEARRTVLGRISKDWQGLRLSLAAFKLVRNYPQSVGEKVLGDQYLPLRRAQIDTDGLLLDGLALNDARVQIEYYLTEAREKIQDVEEFGTLLGQMSGHLLEEFSFVENFFLQHTDWVTSELVRHVEQRFKPIRSGIASRFLRLRRLVAVPRPTTPDPNWEASQWLDWIAGAYMPYHRWLEVQKKYDEELAGYATTFADWFYQNFIDLKNSSADAFAFSALYNDRSALLEENRITLVVILDNLNYGFFPDLRRLFNQNGITLTSERPVFSLIPTATEVGKASVVAVTGDLTDLKTRDYSKIITDTWAGMLKPGGKSVRYLANLGELQAISRLDQQVYFLNYLPVDIILHESTQSYGVDHETRIQEALKVLVGSISEFAQRFKIEKQLVVYVISDHGSTRIAKDVVNVLDKKYFKGISDLQHHRYISISDAQLEQIPQMVEAQCYIIDRKRYKTFQNYLAARQYYRFAETDQDFYVHGGLTPEEVVVPFARFEFTPVEIVLPTLRLLKKDFRYAVKSTIEFEIGNPNTFALENISLQLVGVNAEEVLIDTLDPKKPATVSFHTIFRQEPGSGNTREIVVRMQYESQERSFKPVEMSFTINLKAVMEETQDVF